MMQIRKRNENKVVDLYVIYQMKEYTRELEEIIVNIAKEHKVEICGSGAGFGVRDMHFRGNRFRLRPMLHELKNVVYTLEGDVE